MDGLCFQFGFAAEDDCFAAGGQHHTGLRLVVGIADVGAELLVFKIAHQQPEAAESAHAQAGNVPFPELDIVDGIVVEDVVAVHVGVNEQIVLLEGVGDVPVEQHEENENRKYCQENPGTFQDLPVHGRIAGGLDFSLCFFFLVKTIGIYDGKDAQHHCRDYHDRNAQACGKEGGQGNEDAADHPDFPGETVCGVPVFLTAVGPGDFDTHGGIHPGLGHVVSHHSKEQTHGDHGPGYGGEFNIQSEGVQAQQTEIADDRDGPQDDAEHFVIALPVSFVPGCEKSA